MLLIGPLRLLLGLATQRGRARKVHGVAQGQGNDRGLLVFHMAGLGD
jgi:hypothetical protein